jgi:transposase
VAMDIEDPKAQQRLDVILAHMAGRINATQAAQSLAVSRKTFYEWLERARTGMLAALADRPTGRPPPGSDPEKEALQAELERLEQERAVLASRLHIQEAMRQALNPGNSVALPPKKKRDG